jgi:class 3 adenylate cyclase
MCFSPQQEDTLYLPRHTLVWKPATELHSFLSAGGYDPDHARKMLSLARALRDAAAGCMTPLGQPVEMRIGIHSGPVMSGRIGGGGQVHREAGTLAVHSLGADVYIVVLRVML